MTQSSLSYAIGYLRRGYKPIPIPHGQKKPKDLNWQHLSLTEGDLREHFSNGNNIGLLNGSPSGGLNDVDLDAPEALAIADEFLPATGLISGRKSSPRSHRWYIADAPTEKFVDPICSDRKQSMIVELRGSGSQTLVPPSIHPTGEVYEWHSKPDPAKIDQESLQREVRKLAACALLARYWADGKRHELALSVAGVLLRAGWPETDVDHFIASAATAGGDPEVHDRRQAVTTTCKKLAQDQKCSGLPTLRNLLPGPVVDKIVEWLRLAREPVGKHSDEEELQRLADLPSLEYEHQRISAAKTLNCRPATLDKLVNALRPKTEGGLQGRGIDLCLVEPWTDSVAGAEVLNEVSEVFAHYLALPSGAADVLAVWCAHAHAFEAFDYSPRLNFTSPEKGCGKTTARDVVGIFVPRPLATENLSVAVLFRVIESQKPTLLADECDAWLNNNDELRGLLNSGHRRGGQALRCEGDGNEVRAFNVFGPAVLCGIGSLPGTLHDRAISIRLERAKPGEIHKRFDSRRTTRERELARKLARFAVDNRAELENCDPALPANAFNRTADNWRAIFAIAKIAGGNWPERIADAFERLSRADADEQGTGVMLLADIQTVFAERESSRISSKDLIQSLIAMSDRPWPEANRGRPITEGWLARRLKPFGVLSNTIRFQAGRAKGYELNRFQDAFARYLPSQGGFTRDSVTARININENENSTRDNEEACHAFKSAETLIDIEVSRCHGKKAGNEASRYEPVFTDPDRQEAWDSWDSLSTKE